VESLARNGSDTTEANRTLDLFAGRGEKPFPLLLGCVGGVAAEVAKALGSRPAWGRQ
jgi:hypothetical protein